MKPIRWGVLGVGVHYRQRVSVPLRDSAIVEVAAIASRDIERAQKAARESAIPTAYGSYQALIDDDSIEAVYIPLPNHLHGEWIRKAADAGKHIICEKPLALSADEVQDLIEYTGSRNVRMMEAFMYRFHPQWQRARDIVRIGELGTITSVQSTFFYRNTDPDNIRNRRETGGGALFDIGCYTVSSARFLLGAEPSRVISLVQRDPAFGTDRLSSAILDFGSAQAQFVVGTQTYGSQTVSVYGTGGMLLVELPFNAFPDVPLQIQVRNGVGARTITTEPVDQYALQFEAFSRAIREDAPIPTPPTDALNNQKVLDALFRSEKSGVWESV